MLARLLRGLFKVFSKEKTGYTRRNFWGHSVRYNKEGEKVGWSRKNFWGGRNRYNKNDELTSYTMKNFWGGYNTYDPDGNLIKKSYKNFWGGHNTYDLNGNLEKQTVKNIWKGVDIYEGEPETPCATTKKVSEQSGRSIKPINEEKKPNVPYNRVSVTTNTGRKPAEMMGAGSDVSVHMPNHKIDTGILYFKSIEEALTHYTVPTKYVKILAINWGNLKDVPALAYLLEENIEVIPLIKTLNKLNFHKNDLDKIEHYVKGNISFEEMEKSCLELGISSLGEEYEPLFPEYCLNVMDGSIDIYKLPCGLAVTEKSVENLRSLRHIV